jgi:hypothetical protein
MNCKICNQYIDLPEITCNNCYTRVDLCSNDLVNFIKTQYSLYLNKIEKYSTYEYYDNYKTKAIKNTKLEVFYEIKNMLEYAIKEYTDIDLSYLSACNSYIEVPRMCDVYKGKICNHCGDC